ncbi:feruloyl-CoA synthase [Halodurantibacterium flavum]|uniref:Feruloyl-CoA synthase n=1 Tax=Halodurantibacterium flavum TaxID=1382802 RepID=A0ABW4S824_9RHOB
MADQARGPALWQPEVEMHTGPDGTFYVRQKAPLDSYPARMNERLLHWAETEPSRVWMAQRGDDGEWQRVTYSEAAAKVQSLAQAFIDLRLSADRPLLILSGNSISHALVALAAQHVGVPSAAIAPAYSLVSSDYGKLRDIRDQLEPGLLFVEEAAPFAPAITAVFDPSVPVLTTKGEIPGRETLSLGALAATRPTDAVAQAFDATGPDTVAKFLFTSGTTGSPKAVIQTQRMLCSNQEMIADCYAFVRDVPPVVVDWAPWNHTASGNKVFNLILYNGGTYYIDDGKPTPKAITATIRNLREISPTWYFNVPVGYQMLLDAMETDDQLRTTFFRHLSMMMYAGAGMSQPVWDRLTAVAEQMVPGGVLLAGGFGSTETGPFALMCTDRQDRAGNLGVPARGVELKLVPQGDKLEARVKSPSVTPGYWRNEKLTQEAFDEEGYYCFGDALRFAVPGQPDKGFFFDGRLAENFKLDTGTWVAVGPLRATFTDDMKGMASDVVIAGENRDRLAALVLPDWAALRALVGQRDLPDADLLAHPVVRRKAAQMLAEHMRKATGSSSRVTRFMFIEKPLEFDRGEVTDKGSINQRGVLRNRADLVEALYSDDPRVIEPALSEAQ